VRRGTVRAGDDPAILSAMAAATATAQRVRSGNRVLKKRLPERRPFRAVARAALKDLMLAPRHPCRRREVALP